jgi:hypothetical protein
MACYGAGMLMCSRVRVYYPIGVCGKKLIYQSPKHGCFPWVVITIGMNTAILPSVHVIGRSLFCWNETAGYHYRSQFDRTP